jgi:hypothetical protein
MSGKRVDQAYRLFSNDCVILQQRFEILAATREARYFRRWIGAELREDSSFWTLFQVPLLSVPKRGPYAEGHETEGRKQENHYTLADSPLPILGSGLSRAVTHGAALAKGRHGPQQKEGGKHADSYLHFTPSEMIRRASGKKIIIKARQATREHMVNHFIREISYFMCMK